MESRVTGKDSVGGLRRLQKRSRPALVPLLAVAAWSVCVGISGQAEPGSEPLPAFHEIDQVTTRKQRFFEYLTPVVQAENAVISSQRERLLEIAAGWDDGRAPGWFDAAFLKDLAAEYRLKVDSLSTEQLIDTLVVRVDVIPRSLVLVQAAKESGWGSSRFARSANNLFGQWCFEPGCGMVPRHRPDGKAHEVESFDTVRESVASYMRNLNTHKSYRDLRKLRAGLRKADQPLSGRRLAEGLNLYSERGEAYVREVQAMIRQNDLESGAVAVTGS